MCCHFLFWHDADHALGLLPLPSCTRLTYCVARPLPEGMALVDTHGAAHAPRLLPLFESHLERKGRAAGDTEEEARNDLVREGESGLRQARSLCKQQLAGTRHSQQGARNERPGLLVCGLRLPCSLSSLHIAGMGQHYVREAGTQAAAVAHGRRPRPMPQTTCIPQHRNSKHICSACCFFRLHRASILPFLS